MIPTEGFTDVALASKDMNDHDEHDDDWYHDDYDDHDCFSPFEVIRPTDDSLLLTEESLTNLLALTNFVPPYPSDT